MKVNLIYKTLITGLIALVMVNCNVKNSTPSLAENTIVDQQFQSPQVIFQNYKIKKTAEGDNVVSLINTIVTDGKLKKKMGGHSNYNSGDLNYIQLDENEAPIRGDYIENPLTRVVEYVKEDGTLAQKQLDLDSAEFSLRMQLDENAHFITINLVGENKLEKKHLLKTKVK